MIKFAGDVMDTNYEVITFTSKNIFLRKPRVAIFAGIIKIVIILLKQHLKAQKTLKRLEIMYQNPDCISVFLDITKFSDFL